MASYPAQTGQVQNVPRKAVGRKAVGSGTGRTPSSTSGSPNATAPASLVGVGVKLQENQHLGAQGPQHTPGYFDSVIHSNVSCPSQLGYSHPTSAPEALGHVSVAPSPSRSHTASSIRSVSPRGSVMYDSIAAVSASQSAGTPQHQAFAQPNPQQFERIVPVKSHDSIISSESGASGWPASPGSAVSYQTGVTTPLSRVTTGASRTSSVGKVPIVGRSMSQSSSTSTTQELPTCDQCRAVIQANVSIFECLICSTGGVSTKFCVYCFTTGSAATGHSQHPPSFYSTESDPAVQPEQDTKVGSVQVPPIPSHLWIVKKNAAGRLWYQHRTTGFRTHLRPLLTTVPPPTLLAGWEARSNPDGRIYYFNASTGASTWNFPTAKPLPPGWREVRTPDCVPFYVHDMHQLTCWERPGEQPSETSVSPVASKGISQSSKSKKSEDKSAAVHGVAAAGAAVSVAANIAQLADAAELTPQGIISATVAAARLTTHGAKFAGKKMGKLTKSAKLRRASKIFGTAAVLATISDGAGLDGGEDFEGLEDGGTECGEETVVGDDCGYQEQYAEAYPQQTEDYTPMQTVYEQPTPIPAPYEPAPYEPAPYQPAPCEPAPYEPAPYQPALHEPAPYEPAPYQPAPYEPAPYQSAPYEPAPGFTQYQIPEESNQYPPPEEPPVAANNVYVTENVVYNEATVEQTHVEVTETTQNTIIATETTETIISQRVQTVDAVAPMEPPPESVVPPGSGLPPAGVAETYPTPGYETAIPPPGDSGMVTAVPAAPAQEGTVPPLVFEPVLAGPMMVSPPAEQNGVVFAPTYV